VVGGEFEMSIATITLLALLVAIILSMVSKLNIGLLAIGLAWIIGVYVAGGKPDSVMAGFPVDLFLTLSGVCFLFAIAELNGTFPVMAQRVMGGSARSRVAIPLSFFGSAMVISALGPGAIASTALIVPIAAAIGRRAHIPPMLTALMVANGANAGNLSPISAVGVIANSRMDAAGLGGHEMAVMVANLLAHIFVSLIVWAWFLPKLGGANAAPEAADDGAVSSGFTRTHVITLSVMAVWIGGVVLFKANLALSAFAAGVALILLRVGDEKAAIARMPWGILLMVCGVATLVALVQANGGTELFSALIARVAGPDTVYGVIAFTTGIISTYSSTSGVVLPVFLSMVPSLASATGAADPLAIALSINVGSSLVDVSPLSTLGALCIAALGKDESDGKLYFKLLAWGLAMAFVGAALCQVGAMLLSN
jgi:di/tricarboxylate transporter